MGKEEFNAPHKVTPFVIIVKKDFSGNITQIMERPCGDSLNLASTSGAHYFVNNNLECHYDFFLGANPIKKEYPEKEGKKFNSPFWTNGSTWGFT